MTMTLVNPLSLCVYIQLVLLGVYLFCAKKINYRTLVLAAIFITAVIGQALVYPPAFTHLQLGAVLLFGACGASFLLYLRSGEETAPPEILTKKLVICAFGALMLLSIFLRLYRYTDAVPGLDIDESVKARVGIEIAEGTISYQPFFHFRESLYFYLVAAAFKLLGVSQFALRSVSLVNGMLMLAVLFFFVRSLFGDYPAIASTFFLSFSIWHNTVSKIAERLGLAPQFQLLVLWFLYLSYRKGRWYYFVLCGVSMALGFFGYPPFRVVPISVALILAYILVTDPGFYRRRALHLVLFVAAFCVTALAPLGKDCSKWPEYYLSAKHLGYRVDPSVKGWAEFAKNLPYLIQTWHRSTAPYGTPRPIENIPLLSPVVGILFLIGLGYSLSQARKLPYFMITASFLVGLIPGLFSWPFERRLIGATVITYIFAGIALVLIIRGLCAFPERAWGRRYAVGCFIASLLLIGRENWTILTEKFYFYNHYVPLTLPYQYAARMADSYFIYADIRWFNENSYIFFRHCETGLIPGHRHGIKPFLLGELQIVQLEDALPVTVPQKKGICLILGDLRKKESVTALVRKHYPDAILEKHLDGKGDEVFYSFLIKEGARPEDRPPSIAAAPPPASPSGTRARTVPRRSFLTLLLPGEWGKATRIEREVAADTTTLHKESAASSMPTVPVPAGKAPIENTPRIARSEEKLSQMLTGGEGGEAGRYKEPRGIAIDSKGNIYIADFRNYRIQKFDPEGSPLLAWGGEGNAPGRFRDPCGVAVDGEGRVYVADTFNHRVQVFDADGKYILHFEGGFFAPRGIAVDRGGRIWVADTANGMVKVFSGEGKPLKTIGKKGQGKGEFDSPTGIAVDPQGNVYVAEAGNRRVQVLDGEGNHLTQFAIDGWQNGVFNEPYLDIDARGDIYLSDPLGDRALKYSRDGTLLGVWKPMEGGEPLLRFPMGIAAQEEGDAVYVVDCHHHRIRKASKKDFR